MDQFFLFFLKSPDFDSYFREVMLKAPITDVIFLFHKVPLFISAFRRANELAMAMEARCYHGSEGRTKMKPLKYKKNDRIAYGVLAAYLCAMIALNIFLGGRII